jgi:NAD(P)-dependent dehydrogenase (short-subunit alcohol dehydrogenase family)
MEEGEQRLSMAVQDRVLGGKVCVVTGATSGIGRVTAQSLAQQGASVILVGRNPERGANTVARLREETGNAALEFMLADLSVQVQVRRLAQALRERHPRLHVLVNNAGGFFLKRQLSSDGIEKTFALNYLSPFLLTNLLLDVLRASAPARIVNVSSDMHRGVGINFDDLEGREVFNGPRAYGQSKLALILFTYELARRLEGAQVTANALHPGFVATGIYDKSDRLVQLVAPLIKRMTISPEEGAQTTIYLASAAEVEGVTGKYFYRNEPVPSAPASYDECDAQRLWQISVEMTAL